MPRREEKQFSFNFNLLNDTLLTDSLVPGLSFGFFKFKIPVSIKAAVTVCVTLENFQITRPYVFGMK